MREHGVYCRGSEKFDWIIGKQESAAAAGRASAVARKSKYGTAVPAKASNFQAPAEQNPNGPNGCSERSAEQTERTPNEPPNEPSNDDRTKPNALAPALAPALALTPLLPPSAVRPSVRPREGASRRDLEREADDISARVL